MNYVILHSKCLKVIIALQILFVVASSLYGVFIYKHVKSLTVVFTSVSPRFFIVYHVFLIVILILFIALYYAYGYMKGLRIGRDVTQS